MEHQEELIEKIYHDTFTCPECGAPMRYNPETYSLICDYCSRVINLSNSHTFEEINFFGVGAENLSWQHETQTIKCVNCGNENIISKKEMSSTCPFCGSKQVVTYDSIAGIKPNRVIPFRLTSENAKQCYKEIIRKKVFVPTKVKKMRLDLNINGVYIPSWTYDTNTFTQYSGRLGKRYTVVVGSGKNRRVVTKIRWFSIRGTKTLNFDDILINSGKSLDQEELNDISPYNTNYSLEYDGGYLAGFHAEHYSMDVKSGFQIARGPMESTIKSAILRDYVYDVVGSFNMQTYYNKVTYKYVLLPVWFGLLKYGKKHYKFLVNGETGKIKAQYPKSVWKILALIFGIIAGVILTLYLIYLYGSNV